MDWPGTTSLTEGLTSMELAVRCRERTITAADAWRPFTVSAVSE